MIEQRTDDWFEQRRGLATASHFGEVMAKKTTAARQAYIAQLAWERITGKTWESFQSKDMERGTELEPVARLQYMLQTRNRVEECEFFKHPTLEAGASPDGLVGNDGLLEIKVPKLHNHISTLLTGRIPSQYVWQVVGQQLMTGRKWTDYVSYSDQLEGKAAVVIVRFNRDEDMIATLELKLKEFLDEVAEVTKKLKDYGSVK